MFSLCQCSNRLKELDDSKGAGDNQKMVSVRFVLPREHSKRVNESVEKITEENKQVQIEITNNLEDQSYISISALEVILYFYLVAEIMNFQISALFLLSFFFGLIL